MQLKETWKKPLELFECAQLIFNCVVERVIEADC